ncbi:MAG: sensory transduction protein kinase [Clostridiales bacterium]|nr:sensory transduction protein kinase [Clostridiales bacterium]
MLWLIIILLIIALVVFITLYFISSREIKGINDQLELINNSQTNSKILLSFSNRKLERLAQKININLEEKQKTEIEYKRMDKELRQAIANMSHDFRTPLTSIIGYLQLIEDGKTPEEEKKQYIDIVKKRGSALQLLIESFYDMSRLEAKEYKFDLKPVNLYSIMCDLIASFYNDFKGKGIEPTLDISESVLMVIADEGGVRRILSNLIQNMLRYGDKYVLISLKQQKGRVITVFQNDAPTLSQEDLPHLFERFFTADRTRSGKSTGLGLAITKELVEQMGHNITPELIEGKLSIMIEWKT